LSSKSRQIRPIVERDSPDRLAIDARDQCVALAGLDSSVATNTSSIWSSRSCQRPTQRTRLTQRLAALAQIAERHDCSRTNRGTADAQR
jgi:hypothetical protein